MNEEKNTKPQETQVLNAMIEVLIDSNNEHKKIQKRQTGIIVLLIILMFASFVYFIQILNSFDIESSIITTTSTDNNAKINNSEYTNAQNNINLNLSKLKK